MKYIRFILITAAAVFLASIFFLVNRNIRENETQSSTLQQRTSQAGFEMKTDEQGQVTVKVTPQVLSGNQWKFRVVLDTHSVDLVQDLIQMAELTDDQSNVYKPTAWEGAGPGGHHREGVLIFEAVNPAPSSIALKIKDVGGVPERLFKWNAQ